MIRIPEDLRNRAKAVAALRGETLSDVLRRRLQQYVSEAEENAADVRYAHDVLSRIAAGAPTYSHEEVWAEIEELEAQDALPD
jgi:predicted DNA-binding protein